MTVAELKKHIELLPDDMQVFMAERKTEYTFGLVNSVNVEDIFFEDTQKEGKALILDEE